MRIAWDTVGRIVERVIAERLDAGRLSYTRMLWTGLKRKAAYLPGC
jgi:hypothetical protein